MAPRTRAAARAGGAALRPVGAGGALRAVGAVACGGGSEERRGTSTGVGEVTAERLVEPARDDRDAADEQHARLPLPVPLDLRRTLGPLLRGAGHPTMRFARDGSVWRATWTGDGPATLRLRTTGSEVTAVAWGPGANAVLEGLAALLG